jgi:hypothetical protein
MALRSILSMRPEEREELSRKARQRVLDRYGLASVARRYEDLYATWPADPLRADPEHRALQSGEHLGAHRAHDDALEKALAAAVRPMATTA